VPRYTYRRLTKLPASTDQLRHHTVLNLPGMLAGLSFEHTVMEPGAAVPIAVEDDAGILLFTLAGRSANDLVHIPPGVPFGMQTLGKTDWVYVVVQAPVA
jgi:hypothetical protein